MQIRRFIKGAGTFLGSMAATAIAVQGVAAFFGGITISLFDSAPATQPENSIAPESNPNNFSQPVAPVAENSAAPVAHVAPKIVQKLNNKTPKQIYTPISLPTDFTSPTDALTAGSGGATSSGNWGSNGTSGGSGSSGGGSGSSGGEKHEGHEKNSEHENEEDD